MPLYLTVSLALIAFAGNSVLCRLALSQPNMDASSFTIIRLISGAIMLYVLVKLKPRKDSNSTNAKQLSFINASKQEWLRAFYLFTYAAGFSYAYQMLDTAAGALILFGFVQFTLMTVDIIKGKRPSTLELSGMILALSGFIFWALPSAQTPSLIGSALMAAAGIAWGFYTLAGKNSRQADVDTAKNFILTLPFLTTLIPLYWLVSPLEVNPSGIIYALVSGAITSALGYWLWYQALPKLTTLTAGVLQLSVPILAALGGIIWAKEYIPLSFIVASSLILSGILMVILAPKKSI
ncbi:MAG: DMT family transporter [Bermanella sp.]